MTALNLSPSCKSARSNAVKATIDAAATPGRIAFYSSTRPAAGAAASGLVVEIPLTKPCGTVDSAGLHLVQSDAGQAVASGSIAWGRVTDGDGNWIIDGDASVVAGGDVLFLLDNADVFTGAFVTLLSGLLAEGG